MSEEKEGILFHRLLSFLRDDIVRSQDRQRPNKLGRYTFTDSEKEIIQRFDPALGRMLKRLEDAYKIIDAHVVRLSS